MNKKIRWLLIAAGAAAALGLMIWIASPKTEKRVDPENPSTLTSAPEVQISINGVREERPVYETIEDEETGEQVPAQVQENVPLQEKPTAPPEMPKADGSYTNPDAPPTYTDEPTVGTQPPEGQAPSKEQGSNQVPGGHVYIDGFGYVPEAGEAQTQKGYSDGDINKQVGSMD